MPSDRDQRRRTPGGGVLPVEPKDPHAETIEAIARRAHDTERTAGATLTRVGETHDQVAALRVELGGRIGVLEERFNELAEQTARMDGKLDVLVDVSRERGQIHVAAVSAMVEVEKTGQLEAINERKAKAEYRRTIGLRAVAGVGAVWALVSAMILAGRC